MAAKAKKKKRTKVEPADPKPQYDSIEIDGKTLRFRYEDLLPKLGEDKLKALQADIRRDGITDPIKVHSTDEDGVYDILDGNNRLRLLQTMRTPQEDRDNTPILVKTGMDEADKILYALQKNEARRKSIGSSPARRRKYIMKVREADARKVTTRKMGEALGVSPMTISRDIQAIEALTAPDSDAAEQERLLRQKNKWNATSNQVGSVYKLVAEGDEDRGFTPADLGWEPDELEDFLERLQKVKKYAEVSKEEVEETMFELLYSEL